MQNYLINRWGLSLEFPPFCPPRWLQNGHIQTLLASQKPRRWTYGWQSWEPVLIDLGKAGKLLGEASWQPGRRSDSPLLILLHGLEGSARSHYLIGTSKKAYMEGFHTVRVNARNCGGTEHLTSTLYCAALSCDVLSIVKHFQEKIGIRRLYAAAVSLGANVLLKFLGEQGIRGPDHLQGAVVLSPPLDLQLGAGKMDESQNWIYQRYFVGQLKARMRRKIGLFRDIGDMRRIEKVHTIREFDDLVTAPHFGFGTADNYYRQASCRPLLRHIRVPTLLIHAEDDPLIPFEPFRAAKSEGNSALEYLSTEHGGHAGFLSLKPASPADRDAYWAEGRAVQLLAALHKHRDG